MTDHPLEYIPITEGTEFQWKSNSVLQVLSSESFWKWHISAKKAKHLLQIQMTSISGIFVRCKVLMTMFMMTTLFWNVMSCSLVEIHRYFVGMCYLHIHSTIWQLADGCSVLFWSIDDSHIHTANILNVRNMEKVKGL
jgi:hypothetical protein